MFRHPKLRTGKKQGGPKQLDANPAVSPIVHCSLGIGFIQYADMVLPHHLESVRVSLENLGVYHWGILCPRRLLPTQILSGN